jgi:hypothetical protein
LGPGSRPGVHAAPAILCSRLKLRLRRSGEVEMQRGSKIGSPQIVEMEGERREGMA